MQELIFLKPILQERIWGGTKLQEVFEYPIPSDQTGECWAISAHRNGDCIILNGPLKGKTLSHVYQEYRDLFNHCDHPVFPLLTKILDASHDLSVQVHPKDDYALTYENDLGKTECWYIIDCEPDAEMIFGHHAKDQTELVHMIENNQWDQFLRRVPIKPGDFFYVPSGTLHALCRGTLVLETQQSSDTTYRVYDYDRTDHSGNKRELHLKQAMEVIEAPHIESKLQQKVKLIGQNRLITYVESTFFTVSKWEINEPYSTKNDTFLLVSVLNGEGTINKETIKKGDHFIVTSHCQSIHLNGHLELMISHL